MYRLHIRMPAQTTPIDLASAAAGSPQVGSPGTPIWMSLMPTRESTATPFHWLVPWCATWYPRSVNRCAGNLSSPILVSWIASTSMSLRAMKAVSRSIRARMELTFQVAMRIRSTQDGSGGRCGDEERDGPFRTGFPVDSGPPDQHLPGGQGQASVEVQHHVGSGGQRPPGHPAAAEVGFLDLQGLAEAHHP